MNAIGLGVVTFGGDQPHAAEGDEAKKGLAPLAVYRPVLKHRSAGRLGDYLAPNVL
jgi:hypothetical protein